MFNLQIRDDDDDDDFDPRAKSWYDPFIISTQEGKRSTLLDIWRIYIAFLSIISGVLGCYMSAFMIEIDGSPFQVNSGFELFYLLIELSSYADVFL